MEATPIQVFVRNDKGKIWGPLELQTVELLIDNGMIEGRLQVSQDGVNFAFPGRFPGIRDHFPRELWGDTTGTVRPPAPPGATIALGADPIAPAARPAAPAVAAPVGVISAGPGAKAAAEARAAPRTAAPARAAAAPVVAPAAPSPTSVVTPPVSAAAPAPAASVADSAPKEPLPSSGDLSRTSPIRLYYLAAAGDHTVEVKFKLADREILVHFRKGNPDFIESNHPEDSVQAFLLKNGLATPDQIQQADANLDRFGGELIGALFGLGLLNAGSTFAQLAQRAQGLLLKVVTSESGTFSVEHKELPPHKVMPLGNKWAALTDTARRISGAELRRRLQPVLELPIMKSGGRVQPSELRLTPQETRALSYIDGVRSLAQMGADMPQELEHLLRLAFVLRELESVSFAAAPASRRPPPPATAQPAAPAASAASPTPGPSASGPKPAAGGATPPAAARPAGPPPGAAAARPAGSPPARPAAPAAASSPQRPPAPAAAAAPPKPAEPAKPAEPKPTPEAEIKELKERAAKLKEQNLFEVLGLQQNADSNAVKLAYFKLARLYHPDTVTPDAPPEIGKLKGEIFAAVGDAYRRLGEDKSRAEYIEELKHGGGEQVDVQQILMAEEFFQKGCILVKARKFPEAVKMLDDAVKANDKEGEFYAWRGYAKYFANPDKAAGKSEAFKDFNLALKMNERVGSLHYFMGHVTKLSGDESGAMKHFKKAVEYQPDHTDALRELRMSSGKR